MGLEYTPEQDAWHEMQGWRRTARSVDSTLPPGSLTWEPDPAAPCTNGITLGEWRRVTAELPDETIIEFQGEGEKTWTTLLQIESRVRHPDDDQILTVWLKIQNSDEQWLIGNALVALLEVRDVLGQRVSEIEEHCDDARWQKAEDWAAWLGGETDEQPEL